MLRNQTANSIAMRKEKDLSNLARINRQMTRLNSRKMKKLMKTKMHPRQICCKDKDH